MPRVEIERCPECEQQTLRVVYEGVSVAEEAEPLREVVVNRSCMNPACNSEDANQAAARIVKKATEGK